MGVCCIVFDIDGMLLEFFIFSKRFMLFLTYKKKIGVNKNSGGGGGKKNSGGGGFSSRFMLFPTFKKKKLV